MSIKHTYKISGGTTTGTLTPIKAIRHKCLDCSCWQNNEVRLCTVLTCALYPFRMGKTGNKGKGTGNLEALIKARSMQKPLANVKGF